MSIARMVAESAQTAPARMQGMAEEDTGEMLASGEMGHRSAPPPPTRSAETGGANKNIAAALDVLSKYIPSEVVAIYVFGLSILGVVSQSFPGVSVWNILFILSLILVVFFVIINWLVLKKDGTPIAFPKWPLAAALISFAVWSFAIPGNPLIVTDGAKMLAGFAAIVSSYILAAIEKALP